MSWETSFCSASVCGRSRKLRIIIGGGITIITLIGSPTDAESITIITPAYGGVVGITAMAPMEEPEDMPPTTPLRGHLNAARFAMAREVLPLPGRHTTPAPGHGVPRRVIAALINHGGEVL